jgi:tRNA(adenine34) deaminase
MPWALIKWYVKQLATSLEQSSGGDSSDENDRALMGQALDCAREAFERGEVPVGALLVDEDGAVLARSANAPIERHDPTAHAEILVLRVAGQARRNYRLPRCTLYVTLEPCAMCVGALVHARIARVVFAAPDPKTGACGSALDLVSHASMNHRLAVTGGVLQESSAELLRRFFATRR